jgi:hypothetical protein
VSFQRLKIASFTHSVVYLALLFVWLVPGLHGAEFVLGLSHGLGWIAMSLACVVGVRLRTIPLRLAVAVAVLGGIGPFFGSAEFVRVERQRRAAHRPAVG